MRAIAAIVVSVLMAGCQSRSDRASLMEFLEVYGKSLSHRYDDRLRDIPEDERKIRWYVLFHSDQLAAIDGYLGGPPALSPKARAAVDDIRRLTVEEIALHERLLLEKRYRLSEEEKSESRQRRDVIQQRLMTIGRMIDGLE